MEKFNTINEILDFAIEREQEAVEFYSKMAENSKEEEMKKTFFQFSREEMGHKAKLIHVKEKGMFAIQEVKIMDLKIADYTVNIEPRPDMTYQDALVLAMQKEKAAFKLYQNLADKAQNDNVKSIFLSLAQEEAKHKLRFEIEYDENVLKEN
jgi:rubrerythrin